MKTTLIGKHISVANKSASSSITILARKYYSSPSQRQRPKHRTMATVTNTHTYANTNSAYTTTAPTTVSLTPSTTGVFHVPRITAESAKRASDLLQQNHVKNHIFFNSSGFHNHIAHHLLTIYSLGATPEQLQRGFDQNQSYQRPQLAVDQDVSESRERLAGFYGKERHFGHFEKFFAGEIGKKGIRDTLGEWLFKGDEVAEGLLTRMYAGFLHPVIHFGFGLEFHQPAILVESLAQAAIHDNWIAPYLLGCEKAAKTTTSSTQQAQTKRKTLIDLLHEARSNPTIRSSPRESDGNKTRDGVIGRASEPMIQVASQWTVSPTLSDIRFKTAEMIQTSMYFTAGAQNPKKVPKIDFYYMHDANASIFYSAFLEDPQNRLLFGATEPEQFHNLARMLEMKGRTDLAMYISRNSPDLDMERLKTYEPRHPEQKWEQLFERACARDDDGHLPKLVRAVANAERVCAPYEDEEEWPIRGNMWLNIGHMVMDSVEVGGPKWVRGAGFEKEWRDVPDVGAKL